MWAYRKWLLLALTVFFGVVCLVEARSWYRGRKAMDLCEAVHQGDEEAMRRLLKAGVSPDWRTAYGFSARELATEPDCGWCLEIFKEVAEASD